MITPTIRKKIENAFKEEMEELGYLQFLENKFR